MRQKHRCVYVVIERFVAFGLHCGHIDLRCGGCRFKPFEAFVAFEHALQGFFRALQGFVAEIHGAAVVGLQYEEAYGHGRIGLSQQFVAAGEELIESNEIA